MGVRVSTNLPLRRILYECLQIPSFPTQRIGSFSRHLAHHRLIQSASSPNPHFSQHISIAGLLLRYGFPQCQLHEFIRKNRFLINTSPSDVEKCIGILLSFGLNQNSLVSILSSCPRTLELEFLRKWQVGFSELGLQNLSPSFVQKTLERCAKLTTEPDDLQRSVRVMKNLNFSDKAIFRVLEEVPLAIIKNSFDFGCKIDLLKGVGLKNDEVSRICHLFPGFLSHNLNARLKPLFGDLQDLNFRPDEVRKALLNSPKLLLSMEVGELSRCLDLLNSMKCRLPIKKKILRNGQLSACIEVKLRVDCLCRHGLIHRDAFKVLFIEPRVLIYDLEDIEKKIDFLLCKLDLCIEHLVEFPDYLGVNLEKQIIPRLNVIEHLISIGGLGFDVGMKHLVRLSRLKFYNLFVKPYPECENIFGGLVREAKPQHPTGMWKLFRPQKFLDTKEDVKNMKQFMESLV
ncbi:transcription termination factor MTERF15, mitochondrial [Canna indica]|uniref:Transcription termination factor MTERF15, mitochondrial n=1 Tax=Canna indica TaxID=4628 RepID=A0AAQ3K0W4_9LILI|nr:transcription termination factor MTERF15, mitochondrial [Canna indica]